MSGLWKNRKETPEGKYLVQRRDGTIPAWAWFVLGENDPAAPYALRAYADRCEDLLMDSQYASDIREMAAEWEKTDSMGDPDAPPDIEDNPEIIEKMRGGRSA